MQSQESDNTCQIACVAHIGEGVADKESESFVRNLRLTLRKKLGPQKVRAIKNYLNNIMDRCERLVGGGDTTAELAKQTPMELLKAGDLVRVKSEKEIRSTLNHFGQLKGCGFMPEMAQYCGETRRVLKPIERFVDERDLKAHKAKGVVLLEGAICEGTVGLGRCDRNCFYFWRQEWLERISEKSG